MTIAERIQALCKECHITQTDLEKKLNFGKGTISKWNGNTAPNADKIMHVAEYFCVSVDYLLGRDERKLPPRDMVNTTTTIAAHFDGDEYTDDELEKIKEFAEFVKSSRK